MLLANRNSGIGDPATPPLVLLNAMGLDAEDWGLHFDDLAADRPVVALSRRGHGRTGYEAPEAFECFADDIVETLDHLGVDRFHVLGISMGGCEALDLAIRYGSRVAALTLVNTFASVTAEERQSRLAGLDAAYAATTPAEYAEQLLSGMTRAPLDAEERERIVANLTFMPREVFRGLMVALYRIDLSSLLAHITARTRVFGAAFDQRTPPESVRALAELIPGATFDVIEDAGHFPHLEQPRRFHELVLQPLAIS